MKTTDWKAALAAVRAHQDAQPTYRFRGNLSPQDRPRTPVLNTAESAIVDGVATMRIYDPIDSWGGDWGVSAKEFATALASLGDVTDIRLHINSPGGEVFEAIAIMNQLRAHPAKVTAVVDGLAASSASFIAAAADETLMARNSELMIHDAWGGVIGNAADMRQTADLLDHLSDNIASVYAAKAGGSVEEWRATMQAERWFSAEETVAAGLADALDAPADEQADETPVAAEFDRSVFTYPSRDAAPAPALDRADDADRTREVRYMQRRLAARAR